MTAISAGLPGQYQAWLSTSGADAANRAATTLPSFTLEADGGQRFPFLPAGAWGRVSPTSSLGWDEFGASVQPAYLWTGSTDAGLAAAETCSDFTTTTASTRSVVGFNGATNSPSWTAARSETCNSLLRLICYQVAQGPPHPPTSFNQKRVFVTSTLHRANFSVQADGGTGLEGADELCAARATAAGLTGRTWVALLSTSTTSAAARVNEVGPWFQFPTVGAPVLTLPNVARLHSMPLVAIRTDEFGNTVPDSSVWSGSFPGANAAPGATCGDFTTTVGLGAFGTTAPATRTGWLYAGTTLCDGQLRLYCLEQ